ncbi:cytochrome-c peroxidase [Acetobacter sp. AN02]|uniref:cytochrome-c peroxidase n=1 Tax=Acetobacter sp. AN02 TaxID=2894186 RepID=UPI00243464CA|nr:cytochrome-c peroxidase [Acetobacter sp. AN02]
MRRIILGAIGAGVIAYGGTVAYLTHFDHEGAPRIGTAEKDPVARAAFGVMAEARCDYCHAKGVNLPFYFSIPVAKQIMQRDLTQGLRHFRIEPVLSAMQKGEAPPYETLSRIEEVIRQNRMPPPQYLLMHWHAHLSEDQRKIMLDWIAQTRAKYYATPGVADRFRSEPVQPVPESLDVNADKVALGQKLFFDKNLSGDNTLNCASCHDLNRGGVDHLVTATGIHGQKGPINVPTVYNSAFNVLQFWDGRAKDLQDQAAGPVMNPLEMGSHNWEEVAGKLKQDPDYTAAFGKIYPDQEIGKDTITNAIAEFEKTLITPDSRFDAWLKGDEKALTAQEKHGYDLFRTVGCSGCHSGPAAGGGALEVMGLEGDYFADRGGKQTDADEGRFNVTKDPLDRHRFKVPTLRNVELTGPWFHDGSVKTLHEAVRKMAIYQTPDKSISEKDVDDITAFLKTLTGKYNGKQLGQAENVSPQ